MDDCDLNIAKPEIHLAGRTEQWSWNNFPFGHGFRQPANGSLGFLGEIANCLEAPGFGIALQIKLEKFDLIH